MSLMPSQATTNLSDCLSQVALLRDLAAADLRQISERMHSKEFPANTPLMTAEQPGEAVYFIVSGTVKVQVLIAPDGRVKDVKVIGGHPLFVDATIEALKKWKYMPSNAEATATLEFNFHP